MTNHYKWHEHFTMFTLKEIVLGADYHIMNSKGTYQDTIQEKLIKFTDYLLFKDGTIIVNPNYEDIDRFEELTEGAGGYFNPDFVKIIRSLGKFRKRKTKSDEYSVPPFEWNSKETLELFDLIENEKKEDNTYKNLGIESPYIKALQHLYFTFYQWHKKNRLPIDSDIKYHLLMKEKTKKESEDDVLIGEVSNNNESLEPLKEIENQNPVITPPVVLQGDIKKESKTERKRLEWHKSRETLESLLNELKSKGFIEFNGKIKKVIDSHFIIKCEEVVKSYDSKHYIKWKKGQKEILHLFNDLLCELKAIKKEDKYYKFIEQHFIGQKKQIQEKKKVFIKILFKADNLKKVYSRFLVTKEYARITNDIRTLSEIANKILIS